MPSLKDKSQGEPEAVPEFDFKPVMQPVKNSLLQASRIRADEPSFILKIASFHLVSDESQSAVQQNP